MLFSPIGEELLSRGMAHEALAPRPGNRGAALVDAGAFAITHPAHLGIALVAHAAFTLAMITAIFSVAHA